MKNLYNHTKKAISREMSVNDFVMRLTLVIKMGKKSFLTKQ